MKQNLAKNGYILHFPIYITTRCVPISPPIFSLGDFLLSQSIILRIHPPGLSSHRSQFRAVVMQERKTRRRAEEGDDPLRGKGPREARLGLPGGDEELYTSVS